MLLLLLLLLLLRLVALLLLQHFFHLLGALERQLHDIRKGVHLVVGCCHGLNVEASIVNDPAVLRERARKVGIRRRTRLQRHHRDQSTRLGNRIVLLVKERWALCRRKKGARE